MLSLSFQAQEGMIYEQYPPSIIHSSLLSFNVTPGCARCTDSGMLTILTCLYVDDLLLEHSLT